MMRKANSKPARNATTADVPMDEQLDAFYRRMVDSTCAQCSRGFEESFRCMEVLFENALFAARRERKNPAEILGRAIQTGISAIQTAYAGNADINRWHPADLRHVENCLYACLIGGHPLPAQGAALLPNEASSPVKQIGSPPLLADSLLLSGILEPKTIGASIDDALARMEASAYYRANYLGYSMLVDLCVQKRTSFEKISAAVERCERLYCSRKDIKLYGQYPSIEGVAHNNEYLADYRLLAILGAFRSKKTVDKVLKTNPIGNILDRLRHA